MTIRRPIEEVYAFYRNFDNLPTFLGDVVAIEQTGPLSSRWTIQGPLGMRVHWTTRVTESRPNEVIRYEIAEPAAFKTSWEIRFSPGATSGETRVHEVMRTPLGRLGRLGLALIGKFPADEVSANLTRLKEILETGRVSTTKNAVRGKFGFAHGATATRMTR